MTHASTAEICEAAGVSSSQLYHYFADKGSLVRAVIAYQTERVLGVQREYLGHLDSIHALRKWRDLLVGIEQGLRCEGGFLLTQVRRNTASLEVALDTMLDYIESLATQPEYARV